eukprot:scaffold952_cov29-Attheya_sp.AAC.3
MEQQKKDVHQSHHESRAPDDPPNLKPTRQIPMGIPHRPPNRSHRRLCSVGRLQSLRSRRFLPGPQILVAT